MKMSRDDEQVTLQHDVQRLLGRCMLRLQQYEGLIKAVLASSSLSGTVDFLGQTRAEQTSGTSLKTLGILVGELLGSYLGAGEISHTDETESTRCDNINRFAMQLKIGLTVAEFDRVERDLRELVQLRNTLVHHFFDDHDISSSAGCRRAKDELITAYTLIDRHLGQLRQWAEIMEKTRQAMSEVLQSKEIEDCIVNGIPSDEKLNCNGSGIESALRDAFNALAVDGWTPLTEAGKWVTERHPKQIPAKYGRASWRQVVHETRSLELRYFETNGKRTAFYRKR